MSAAGLVARMPIAMIGLGLVLLVQSVTGSYAVAGGVSATFALSHAAASPWLARATDRRGQRAVALPALAVHAGALGALLALAAGGAPTATLFACAAFSGAAMPDAGVLVRARWARLLAGRPALEKAYSVESVLDEVCFVVGPVLVTVLATRVGRLAGLLVSLALGVGGTLALLAQRRTEPPAHPASTRARAGSALRHPGLRVLTVVAVAMGGLFGSVEVSTVASAAEHGGREGAGPVLAAFALASLLAGVVYGAMTLRAPLARRFVVTASWMGLAVCLLPLARSLPAVALVLAITGAAIAPTLIATFGLVQQLTPPGRLTEGMTWVSTGLAVGVAAGSAVAGRVVDAAGGRAGSAVASACGVAVLAAALAGRRALRSPAGRAQSLAAGSAWDASKTSRAPSTCSMCSSDQS